MGKYTKKPVTIEAVQFNGCETVDDVREPMFDLGFSPPAWIVEGLAKSPTETGSIDVLGFEPAQLKINTLEGYMTAQPGDFIIQGVSGEVYPCKPEIFAKTYDAEG